MRKETTSFLHFPSTVDSRYNEVVAENEEDLRIGPVTMEYLQRLHAESSKGWSK
jgi:hypothetical protein